VVGGPSPRGVSTYAVREEAGKVSVCLGLSADGAPREAVA